MIGHLGFLGIDFLKVYWCILKAPFASADYFLKWVFLQCIFLTKRLYVCEFQSRNALFLVKENCAHNLKTPFFEKRLEMFLFNFFRKRFGEQPDGQPEQRRGQPSRYHTQVLLLSNIIKLNEKNIFCVAIPSETQKFCETEKKEYGNIISPSIV